MVSARWPLSSGELRIALEIPASGYHRIAISFTALETVRCFYTCVCRTEEPLDFNPYTERCSVLHQDLQSLRRRRDEIQGQLAWHERFNPAAAHHALALQKQRCKDLSSALDGIREQHASAVQRESSLATRARLSLDPRQWFSAERRALARKRDAARLDLSRVNGELMRRVDELRREKVTTSEAVLEIERYDSFSAGPLQQQLATLQSRLVELGSELERQRDLRDELDANLKPLLEKHQGLSSSLEKLYADLAKARALESQLDSADNSYQRAMAHNECGRIFYGEGSPGKVVQRKTQEIANVNRQLEKVRTGIKQLSNRMSRQIDALVIDGNNLCYESTAFVGLAPLLALTKALSDKYETTVIFDASIRRLLQMSDREVAHDFPTSVRIHIVASRTSADETVLATAAGPDRYVISNDRFQDFAGAAAVRGNRLIRHEIVSGKVMVHDLGVVASFASSSAA